MNDIVKEVNSLILISFADGRKYKLPVINPNYMTEDLETYCNGIKLVEKSYATSGKNIVGNICSNSLEINVVSNNKLLISSNKQSTYAGLMNDTAYIDIWAKDANEDWLYTDNDEYIYRADNGLSNKQYLGRYYVSAWENGTTSSTSNDVTISCVDLLSKIKNISLTKVRLRRKMTFKSYIKILVDKINVNLPDHMKVLYDEKLISTDWEMYFNNIDRDDIESVFNNIAQNTISYIYIDRTRHIRTDSLLDDSDNEPISNLSGITNIFEYGSQSGDIDSYSGVEVEYVESIAYEDKKLLELKDYQLYSNDKNEIIDATLNSSNVFNIHHVEIECKSGNAVCTSFINYKNNIDIREIKATNKTKADISVYGTVINETTSKITRYKDNNNKSTVISIKNKILNKKHIKTYVNDLINLMKLKDSRLYAQGYISPYINLGDMVYIVGTRLDINDKYKVVGIELTLGTDYRCKLTLLKTHKSNKGYSEILFDYTNLFHSRLSGEIINTDNFIELSEDDNNIVKEQLENDLLVFENRLAGGA